MLCEGIEGRKIWGITHGEGVERQRGASDAPPDKRRAHRAPDGRTADTDGK